MQRKPKKPEPDKQRKLIKMISANLGHKKQKSTYEMMLEAGYAEPTARQQSTIVVRIQEKMAPIVSRLEAERERIIDNLTTRDLNEEYYKDLVYSFDKLTKNIQLLSGKPTDIVADFRLMISSTTPTLSIKQTGTTSI